MGKMKKVFGLIKESGLQIKIVYNPYCDGINVRIIDENGDQVLDIRESDPDDAQDTMQWIIDRIELYLKHRKEGH